MKQYTRLEFVKIVKANGFSYKRSRGGHDLYYNDSGRHISIPRTLVNVIAHRLIKENNLKLSKSQVINKYIDGCLSAKEVRGES